MTLIQSWWDWCSESFGHMFVGVTAPLLLVFAVAVLFLAGGEPDSTSESQPPRSDVAGTCVDGAPGATPAPGCGTVVSALAPDGILVHTATAVPPTPTPAPRSYTVQSGDTLSLICAAEVPEMALDTCVAAIVSLSNLGGPDEIAEGQSLRLPPAVKASPTPSTPTTSTRSAASSTGGSTANAGLVFEPESNEAPEEDSAGDANESSSSTEPEPVESEADSDDDESAPRASLVALEPTEEPTATATPSPTATPRPIATLPPGYDLENATLYTVQPGDSLLSICDEQRSAMDIADCVFLTVELNSLQGPDAVYAYQGLLLP